MLMTSKTGGGLYDFDGTTLSKVLKCHHSESITYDRFQYSYQPELYREATAEDIAKYKSNYYNEDSTQGMV